ncbi:MAG: hypothetical protein J5685_01595 [Clostridiales bacterium]|nr:hypothetical protein [Clostridiales bacterium]
MIEPRFISFLIPGLIFGLITGIALAAGLIAERIMKRNLVSEARGRFIPKYSSNGLEVLNGNMSDSFETGGYNGSKPKKSGFGYIDREDEDNLEYFKRNLDLNYVPVKKNPVNLNRKVNRRKTFGGKEETP